LTIEAILEAVNQIDANLKFAVDKVKQGYGVDVIKILTILTDNGLDQVYQPSNSIVVKGILDKNEDEMVEYFEEGDDMDLEINVVDDYTIIDDDVNEADYEEDKMNTHNQDKLKEILVSQSDQSEWRLEVERVLPQLKVILRPSDHKADWRSHVNEMKLTRDQMEKVFDLTRVSIQRLSNELTQTMSKIKGREKFLQEQLEVLINEYISLKSHLKQITDNYKLVSGGLTEKSKQLASICEELDALKEEMEEREASMTDGTPLINIRKSLQKIKTDIASIDIRIGVSVHTLLQVKLSESTKGALERQTPAFMNRAPTLQELDF